MRFIIYILFLIASFSMKGQMVINSYQYASQPSSDPAADYIAAVEGGGDALDATQEGAITTLVSSLQSAGIWTKLTAIYPFIGGTATAHKWNLKAPQDTDGAYRLVFNGTWTHDANGAATDGTTAYANTFLNPTDDWNWGLFVYNGDPTVANSDISIGVSQSGNMRAELLIENDETIARGPSFGDQANPVFTLNQSDGFHAASRTSDVSLIGFTHTPTTGEASAEFTTGASTLAVATIPYYLGALNTNNAAGSFAQVQFRFAAIGQGLTLSEIQQLDDIVETYQDTLTRGVLP